MDNKDLDELALKMAIQLGHDPTGSSWLCEFAHRLAAALEGEKDREIAELHAQLAAMKDAEPLGKECQKVLDDNRWDLYEGPHAQPAVPDGMVLVPREPTAKIIQAMGHEWSNNAVMYRAAIAAAEGKQT